VKILIYTHEFPPSPGGGGRYSYEIAKGLHEKGNEITVLTERREGKINVAFDFEIIRMPRINSLKKAYIPIGFFYLFKTLILRKFDRILLTDAGSQRVYSVYNIFNRKSYIVLSHGSEVIWALKSWFPKRYFLFRFYRNAAGIIANSRYTYCLVSKIRGAGSKISIVYPGVNAEEYLREKDRALIEKLRNRFNLREKKIILSLSRLELRKGQDMVIKSLPRISEQISNSVYIIAGEGKVKNYLKSLADKCGVSDRVVFTGSVTEEEKIALMDLADVYVLPNRLEKETVEGFGITFVEAALRKLALIAGSEGGAVEIVENGISGQVVDPRSEAEIAAAVIKCLTEHDFVRKTTENAYIKCLREFDFSKNIEKVVGIITK